MNLVALKVAGLLLTSHGILVSTAFGGAPLKVKLDPRNTYLHTNSDPAGDAVPIDLIAAGFPPGSHLRLTRLGDYDNGPMSDTFTSLLGVFSASSILRGSDDLNRVQDALDASVDFHSQGTYRGGEPTDIPEDFLISSKDPDHTFVTVPAGATHLFLTPHDSLFYDNTDPDADYAILVEEVPPGQWTDLGFGLSGTSGIPTLVPSGTLFAGELINLSVSNIRPLAPAVLFFGLSRVDLPFKGGILVPAPQFIFVLPPASSVGTLNVQGSLPYGVPDLLPLYFQFWFIDPNGPQGMSASNAVEGVTPGA